MIKTMRKTSDELRAPLRTSVAYPAVGSRSAFRAASGRSGSAGGNAPLEGLSSSALSDRFRSWRGRSGRRYVFSAFRLDRGLDGLPLEADAVVIAVLREADGTRRKLWVAETGGDARAFFRSAPLRSLAARSDAELHIHLLADTASARRAMVDDLGGV